MNCKRFVLMALIASLALCTTAQAQSPGVLYTWSGTGNVQDWARNFGDVNVALDNNTAGELTITESSGGLETAYRDGFNRIRESSSVTGGLDLTGLDFLEFDLGHDGVGNVDVQFYVQATPGFNFVALSADVSVGPGVSTYQLPLSNLSAAQQTYIRTIGFTPRDHSGAEGDLVWTLEEVRSGGTTLVNRKLVTHDAGTSDAGLQGAITNFDLGAIQGNDGGQNQTGLSQNLVDGSLQWTDLGDHGQGDPSGGAVTWYNGTAWGGSTFNERLTDFSNYNFALFRVKATDVDPDDPGGTVGVQPFVQTGPGFSFQPLDFVNLPIDGAYHDLYIPFAGLGLLDMQNVQATGINLGSHTNDITFDVDLILLSEIPEPSTFALFGLAAGCMVLRRRVPKKLLA